MDTDDRLSLADWVKTARRAAGLTAQRHLAERMSAEGGYVDTSYVKQLESGKINVPQQPYLGQLARALGRSEVEILRAAGLITEPPIDAGSVDHVRHTNHEAEIVAAVRKLPHDFAAMVLADAEFLLRQTAAAASDDQPGGQTTRPPARRSG